MKQPFEYFSPEKRAEIVSAVGKILAQVDADIAARAPVCEASGRCCKFEAYGHRLYVSAAELVYFAAMMARDEVRAGAGPEVQARGDEKRGVSLPQFFGGEQGVSGCPYQVENLCTAREARPLGCRIYFCDPGAQGWQNEVYEKYHSQLVALHEATRAGGADNNPAGLAYEYLEWREALKRLLPESR